MKTRRKIRIASGRPPGPARRRIHAPTMRAARARLAISMDRLRIELGRANPPVHVKIATLYTWENGTGAPPEEVLPVLAKILNATVEQLTSTEEA